MGIEFVTHLIYDGIPWNYSFIFSPNMCRNAIYTDCWSLRQSHSSFPSSAIARDERFDIESFRETDRRGGNADDR